MVELLNHSLVCIGEVLACATADTGSLYAVATRLTVRSQSS
jgi:hypothetical protein